MAAEIHSLLQTLFLVSTSLSICFSIRNSIPNGFLKFLLVLPFFFLFLYIPLQFHTIHFQGPIGFFIGWLGSFKLLLFAFGRGPLCSAATSSSLPRFLAVGSLPIEIPDHKSPPHHSLLPPSAKLGFLILTILAINFKNHFHQNAVLLFYCLLIYFFLEFLIGTTAALAKKVLGVELLPYFNEPYLSDSLQDFWGRRWNLMTSRILRLAVYDPCRNLTVGIIGRRRASMVAVMATFGVSGLMHELIYFYMGRMAPTWEVSCFFVVHGVCVVAERAVKLGAGGRYRAPRAVRIGLTIGFVMGTGSWLFFPQCIRAKMDVRMLEEYAAMGAFLKDITVLFIDSISFLFK
ncbi:hypothetical protein IC575_030211 [Cucumis melo]|uniref:Acyl-CoA--sterol O-acyltransferase 1-like n=1 Tax=Cucumis melo TaxID=3656 RepID=A0A1S3CG36_CUCME|nr:acyl-CoA--sterol O-acyltransferase 1-like [Cucumis melo]